MHKTINNNAPVIVLMCAWISIIVPSFSSVTKPSPQSYTTITTKNVTEPSSYIDFTILDKPHHLFIGRCLPEHKKYHAENIIVNNDGKSHVSADIRVNVDGPIYITCAKIFDQIPNGQGGYPSYISGGVGKNYVEFGVTTEYGKGFHFYVEIFGYDNKDKEKN